MNQIQTLEQLYVDHPYYANMSNYYSNDPYASYESWSDFYSEWNDADIDYNTCYRFDLKKPDPDEGTLWYMQIIIIMQRKGIYKPIEVFNLTDDDVPQIVDYLKKHRDYINEIWKPL